MLIILNKFYFSDPDMLNEEDDIVAADLDMHQLILNSEAHQAVVSKTKSSFYCVGLAKFMTFRIQ